MNSDEMKALVANREAEEIRQKLAANAAWVTEREREREEGPGLFRAIFLSLAVIGLIAWVLLR